MRGNQWNLLTKTFENTANPKEAMSKHEYISNTTSSTKTGYAQATKAVYKRTTLGPVQTPCGRRHSVVGSPRYRLGFVTNENKARSLDLKPLKNSFFSKDTVKQRSLA